MKKLKDIKNILKQCKNEIKSNPSVMVGFYKI